MKKYIKPNIRTKKIRINFFFVRKSSRFNNLEGLLAVDYTCAGKKTGYCAL